MRSWIKGGLIGLGIGFLIIIIYFLIGSLPFSDVGKIRVGEINLFAIVNYLFLILLSPLGIFYFMGLPQSILMSIIYILISYSLIGALIGWLVRKIKSRDQK